MCFPFYIFERSVRMNAKLIAFGAKALTNVKKAAPTIMIVVGVAASVAATVEAVKSTLKAEELILDPAKKEFDTIKQAEENPAYTPEAKKIDRRAVYIRSAGRALKLYGKPLALWALSMVMIIGAHKVQCDRLTRAINYGVAATTALTNMHDNTKQVFGDDIAMALRTGDGIPEAVNNCDFDKVKDSVAKKIQYKSDSLREYPDKEVSYRHTAETLTIVPYCQSTVKPNYWNSNILQRLESLQSWENMYNELLINKELDVVTGTMLCNAIGIEEDNMGPVFDIMGWWYDGTTQHPIDLGLGKLYSILHDKTLTASQKIEALTYNGVNENGQPITAPWQLVFNFTGDTFEHKHGLNAKDALLSNVSPATLY